jgi:hypothetical protein
MLWVLGFIKLKALCIAHLINVLDFGKTWTMLWLIVNLTTSCFIMPRFDSMTLQVSHIIQLNDFDCNVQWSIPIIKKKTIIGNQILVKHARKSGTIMHFHWEKIFPLFIVVSVLDSILTMTIEAIQCFHKTPHDV